jgi:Cache domain
VASGLFPERNGYVYYGSETGRFVGIQRNAPGGAEIRIRAQPNELRRVYRVVSPNERGELLREENYDPHSRPWYQQAMARKALSWSPIYRNFAQRNLTITLAKPVLRADGTIRGVAATDIALTSLEKLVQSLRVSENSVAFVVERDGSLVASSADRELALSGSGDARLAASKSASALVRDAFAAATALATQSTEKKSATLSERVSIGASSSPCHAPIKWRRSIVAWLEVLRSVARRFCSRLRWGLGCFIVLRMTFPSSPVLQSALLQGTGQSPPFPRDATK